MTLHWHLASVLCVLALSASCANAGKFGKTRQEWNAKMKKLKEDEDKENHMEYEKKMEKTRKSQPQFDMNNPQEYIKKMQAGGGMMSGANAGQPGMGFVQLKLQPDKETTESIVALWSSKMLTGAVDAKCYVIEKDMLLLQADGSIIAQVRDFALDQPEVEYFTFSNVDYYKKGDPRATDKALAEKSKADFKKAQEEQKKASPAKASKKSKAKKPKRFKGKKKKKKKKAGFVEDNSEL